MYYHLVDPDININGYLTIKFYGEKKIYYNENKPCLVIKKYPYFLTARIKNITL